MTEIQHSLPHWYPKLQSQDWRKALLWGGRMGFKTKTVMVFIVLWMLQPVLDAKAGRDVFIGREYEGDLDDSLWKEFVDAQQTLGVEHLFKNKASDMSAECLVSGRKMSSGGLFAKSKKGGRRGMANFGLLVLDEVQEMAMASLLNLWNTIFRNPGARAICMFNRDDYSAIWQLKEKAERSNDPETLIIECNWADAAFHDEATLEYIAKYELDHPHLFPHDFEGKALVVREAQVFDEADWRMEDLDHIIAARVGTHEEMRPMFGLDVGWTKSKTALTKSYFIPDLECVYVSDAITATHLETRDFPAFVAGHDMQYPHAPRWENKRNFKGLIPSSEIRQHVIWSDTDWAAIRELRNIDGNRGFQVEKAKDMLSIGGPVKAAEFYQRLRGGIVMHPERAHELKDEIVLLRHPEHTEPHRKGTYDRSKIMKGNDHLWDSLRYGNVELIVDTGEDAGYEVIGLDRLGI